MRIRHRLPSLALGLALLLTQWLTFAHALEHPALRTDKACAVCIVGIHLDSGAPLPQMPSLALAPQLQTFALTPAPVTAGCRPTTARARAPPLHLV